jgi:hypothetical protein
MHVTPRGVVRGGVPGKDDQVPSPTPEARTALDFYIEELAALADGLTVDDFRLKRIVEARQTSRRVRIYIVVFSIAFLLLAIGVLITAQSFSIGLTTRTNYYEISFAAVWALALGGLGAVASIFINVLKLMPQETLRTSDEFEVIGRIILGCLFSTILSMTLAPEQLAGFFEAIQNSRASAEIKTGLKGGVILLLPFLAGYSIQLVLKLLEKAILAVELTIGLDDRRAIGVRQRRGGSRGRRRFP